MSDRIHGFGETAKGLARNPLGIISLLIVLVYGFASLVAAFAGSFTAAERLPLIYFLVFFPVLVLVIFAWLVSKHSGKLFAPSGFKDEENYVKMQMAVVGSLSAATAKGETPALESEIHRIIEAVRSAGSTRAEVGRRSENYRGRRAMRILGRQLLRRARRICVGDADGADRGRCPRCSTQVASMRSPFARRTATQVRPWKGLGT